MYMWNWYKKWVCLSFWSLILLLGIWILFVVYRDGFRFMYDIVIMGDSIIKSFRCFNES